ncbi:MAG: TonB-dependent hemoglobin/transferrin/lactoferrin family receptor [Gammaproteobacteria bacterium]|nr:TonB-dependent hemoglobin/transferrin/lactoferrin family receptor [Gammaproteobacteria bacterium]
MFNIRLILLLYVSILTFTINADDIISDANDDEVIVVLGKVPRPLSDVVGSATIIGSQAIDAQLVHNISDLVRYQSGISIENSGTRFGQAGFSIRGISGNRVITEIDGIPVSDQFDVGSYSNSGRNFVDTDLIQQVEILRGPASSIYGSDAIGGVVSFITKKPVDLLSQTEKDIYLGFKTGYYSADNSHLLSATTAFGGESSSALLSVSLREGHELDNQAVVGSGLDHQDNETQSILAKYHYMLSANSELIFSYDYFNRQAETEIESNFGFGQFSNTTGFSGDDESERENFAINYEFVLENDWLEGGVVRLYQQKTATEQLTDETRFTRGVNYLYDRDFFYKQDVNGMRLNLYASPSSLNYSHTIGYGFELSKTTTTELRNSLQTNLDTGEITSVVLGEQFPLRDFPITDVTEYGIYINDEIRFKDTPLSIVLAARFDSYELTPRLDTVFLESNVFQEVVNSNESSKTPKLGMIYQLSDESQFYAQYIRGFRAPPFEDVNVSLALDVPVPFPPFILQTRAIPNPDLKSETSDGYELGYTINNNTHQFNIAAFYNDYKDFIETKRNMGYDPVTGYLMFQSRNIENTKIYGIELSYNYTSESWLANDDQLTTSVSLHSSKGRDKMADLPLNSIDPEQLLLGINWLSPDQKWSIFLYSTIVAGKDDVDETIGELFKPDGYGIVDLIGNYQINDSTSISFAINNLTDRKYWQWSAVGGMLVDDPIIESLSAPGINGSVQLRFHW